MLVCSALCRLLACCRCRYQNANDMATMARALDRFQAITLRASFLQRCYLPIFAGTAGCDGSAMAMHHSKLSRNVNLARQYHHELYLGASGLHPFSDSRLLVSD